VPMESWCLFSILEIVDMVPMIYNDSCKNYTRELMEQSKIHIDWALVFSTLTLHVMRTPLSLHVSNTT
jgi:hypothetical protein